MSNIRIARHRRGGVSVALARILTILVALLVALGLLAVSLRFLLLVATTTLSIALLVSWRTHQIRRRERPRR